MYSTNTHSINVRNQYSQSKLSNTGNYATHRRIVNEIRAILLRNFVLVDHKRHTEKPTMCCRTCYGYYKTLRKSSFQVTTFTLVQLLLGTPPTRNVSDALGH